MVFEVTGKVALITGASSGLGYCIAKTLLQQGLKGLTMLDIDEAKGQEVTTEFTKEFGQNICIFRKTDVSNEAEVEDAFKETIKTFKQLDIVINNAAVISELNWKQCIDTNLGGCLIGTKLAIDNYLCKYKSGSEGIVINISSIAGLQPIGATPVYSITKHGIVALGHMKTPMVLEFDLSKFNLMYFGRFAVSLNTLNEFPIQEPEFVAESLLDIMENGQSGSVWVVEDGKPAYEVEFKDRLSMRKNIDLEKVI